MALLVLTAAVMVVVGLVARALLGAWHGAQAGPRLEAAVARHEAAVLRAEGARRPRLAGALARRLDPAAVTGLALTATAVVVVLGIVTFGIVTAMVEGHSGLAALDASASRFAARHATHLSTAWLRELTQLGGAVLLVPLAVVVLVVRGRRLGVAQTLGFLVATVGGQFALANLVKALVDRARPDIDRLTGFSGPSFPSGHATAASCCFAAFALLIGARRPWRQRAALGACAAGLAAGIATTRVLLGVHWLTDVVGGSVLGYTWFALCTAAFGGRLLRFGQPVEEVEEQVATADRVEGTKALPGL